MSVISNKQVALIVIGITFLHSCASPPTISELKVPIVSGPCEEAIYERGHVLIRGHGVWFQQGNIWLDVGCVGSARMTQIVENCLRLSQVPGDPPGTVYTTKHVECMTEYFRRLNAMPATNEIRTAK